MKPSCEGDVAGEGFAGTLASLEGLGVAAGGVVVGAVWVCPIVALSKARAQTVV
jgi:hypothetical protein